MCIWWAKTPEPFSLRGIFFLPFALVSLCLFLLVPSPGHAGEMYYYKDQDGVMHVTDVPDSDKYKPFLVYGNATYSKQQLKWLVRKYGSRYGVDPALGVAVLKAESDFRRKAVSSAGAQGLMQIMPGTQKELEVSDPFDPEDNIAAGIRYLGKLLDRYDGLRKAVAAYNAGPQAVDNYDGIPPYRETERYVNRVITLYTRYRDQN